VCVCVCVCVCACVCVCVCVCVCIDKEKIREHGRPMITTSSTESSTQLHPTSKDCKPGKQSATPNKCYSTSKTRTTRAQTSNGQANHPLGAAHPGAPAPNHGPARQRTRRAKHATADAEYGNGNQRTDPTRAIHKVATRAQKTAPEETT
jgi:hypothetical protein